MVVVSFDSIECILKIAEYNSMIFNILLFIVDEYSYDWSLVPRVSSDLILLFRNKRLRKFGLFLSIHRLLLFSSSQLKDSDQHCTRNNKNGSNYDDIKPDSELIAIERPARTACAAHGRATITFVSSRKVVAIITVAISFIGIIDVVAGTLIYVLDEELLANAKISVRVLVLAAGNLGEDDDGACGADDNKLIIIVETHRRDWVCAFDGNGVDQQSSCAIVNFYRKVTCCYCVDLFVVINCITADGSHCLGTRLMQTFEIEWDNDNLIIQIGN